MTEAPTSQAATAPSVHTPPVVIVGVGLAGLTTVLHLADQMPVVMLAKRKLEESATARAQGGIVGVLASDDSIENHVHDTQIAGAGIVDEYAACHVAAHSADAIAWLLAQGVPFTGDPAGPLGLHLTREGGHGTRRIAHVADATGQAIHATLLEMARRHPNITLHERWMALDLITDKHLGSGAETPIRNCYGVYVLDIDAGKVMTHRQLLQAVWGQAMGDNSHYLRIYVGHLRHKLEADPAQPQHFLTETGVGYRFQL